MKRVIPMGLVVATTCALTQITCGDWGDWNDAKMSPALTGCRNKAAFTVDPVALSITGMSGLLLSGTVQNAPCGVKTVSLLDGFTATSTSGSFATWSAMIPLTVLESQPECYRTTTHGSSDSQLGNAGAVGGGNSSDGAGGTDSESVGADVDAAAPAGGAGGDNSQTTGGDGAIGILVTGTAVLTGDPGSPDIPMSFQDCVSLTPPLSGSTCGLPAPTGTCASTVDNQNWSCALPVGPNAPRNLVFYTSADLIGSPVSWRSTTGGTFLEPTSPVITENSDHSSQLACCVTEGACSGIAIAHLSVAATTAGLDVVTATVGAAAAPAQSWAIAYQGPAQIEPVPTTLSATQPVDVFVRNPFGFMQTCSVVLPPGVNGAIASDDGAGGAGGSRISCPLSSAATCPFTPARFQNSVQHYVLTADGPVRSGSVSIECIDEFEQAAFVSILVTVTSDGGAGG